MAWRKSPERILMAREILNNPNMGAMLATLELDHPAKGGSIAKDGFGATFELGVINGYEKCLYLLKSLGVSPPVVPEEFKSTWGAPVDQDNK